MGVTTNKQLQSTKSNSDIATPTFHGPIHSPGNPVIGVLRYNQDPCSIYGWPRSHPMRAGVRYVTGWDPRHARWLRQTKAIDWSFSRNFYLPLNLNYGDSPTSLQFNFMMTSSNGNIFRVTGHLCREFTVPWWNPHTMASDAKLWCFLWSASE